MAFVSRVLGSGRVSRFARAFALPATLTSKIRQSPPPGAWITVWKPLETPFRMPRLAELCHHSTRDRLSPGRTRKPRGGHNFAGPAPALTLVLMLALHLCDDARCLVILQRVQAGKRSLVCVADLALAVLAGAENP